ncbi:MAG: DUF4433 domain-containing protein [Chloroflexi bacterium]|nr:DUF4433 domain-containing protein [Chloroflexota bacterium]
MAAPAAPKIYHIVHVDRLPSIVADGHLWSDAEVVRRAQIDGDLGTTIGMSSLKEQRLTVRQLRSHPGLYVGQCVPFYFCPRSVMLFMIWKANDARLAYRGGQGPIVHLEAGLHESVTWAEQNGRRWAFTLSNAGSAYFEDRSDLAHLDELDWDSIAARYWQDCKEAKAAEFLVEDSFPWQLVSRIGVESRRVFGRVRAALEGAEHRPSLEMRADWYYGR